VDTAFVLFKTEPSRERDVYLALSELDSIVETHALYGEYDLLACVTCEDAKELTKMLIEELRSIDGVLESQTLIAVDF
tara:strand:+ start:146 stop:379 length:234 start_codon:yes stop_codon:yes gene_type:complete